METKVLLRLIKDDIKLLDEINGSFLYSERLTADEVEVALSRARGLVKEFEMLSKNITQLHDIPFEPEVKVKPKVAEKSVTKQKETPVFNEEAELIDLQEETDIKPTIEKEVYNPNVKDTPGAEKVAQKGKVDKRQMSEAPAKVSADVDLLAVEEVDDEMTPDVMSDDKQQSVNDILSQERIESNFEGIPLKSIRDGIGLNDKLLFIRELFVNDNEKYEKAIATIDKFTLIGQAVEYLKQNFKWNKTEASQRFLALVKRRFTK